MNEELKVIISAQIDKLKANVDKAKSEVKSFKEQVKAASKDVDDAFAKMGSASATAIKGMATGLAAAATALLATSAATAEYRENQAKLATAFETAGSSAAQATETYNDLYRVLGDSGQATEAAGHLAKLTTEEKALSEWTTICQGIYATFGDSLPIESLTEAANETAKTGELTGALADALNWAGISEDVFAEKLEACNSEAEREKLIRETLNGLYNEAAATYETNNAELLKQNEAQANLTATMAALGEAVQPVLTLFTAFASEALAVILPYVKDLAEAALPVLETVLNAVATALEKAFEWASQHKTLLSVLAGIIAGVVAAIGLYNAVAAVKNAIAIKEVAGVLGLVSAYAAQAAAMLVAIAPYALIVAAIAAVIAIIVVCIKHWDKIKETVAKVWENIKQKTNEAVERVSSKFNEMKDKAAAKVDEMKTKVKDGFQNMVSGAKEKCSNIVSTVRDKFSEVKSSITEKINAAKDALKSGIDKMKSFFNFTWELPKIKLPHFSISGKFSLNPPSIPHFSVSWYKFGGVFDKTTLFPYGGNIGGLGEDGAEAIVPLEKNTMWLDRLATMLAEKTGGSAPIVLEVDGKVFAQTAISTINQNTRQTGKLALKLV